MSPILVAVVSAACIFAGALLGLGLQRLLPEQHLSSRTQDVVKLSAGMIGTLTALVLGLLVSSAKSSFDAMSNGIVQSSARIVLLDRALARYGPETKDAREQLKRAVAAFIEVVWPTETTGVSGLTAVERANGIGIVQDTLSSLTPQNDTQRNALAQSQQILSDLSQTRWLSIEQEHNELPLPLLLILVFWLFLLFVSFGLFAPPNATALAVLLLGACAVSAAILLVLELNRPLEGLITVSSGPVRNALQHLDE